MTISDKARWRCGTRGGVGARVRGTGAGGSGDAKNLTSQSIDFEHLLEDPAMPLRYFSSDVSPLLMCDSRVFCMGERVRSD